MLSKYDIVALHCSIMILLYDFVIRILRCMIWYHDITLWYCDMIYDVPIAIHIAIHNYSGPGFGPTELGRKW